MVLPRLRSDAEVGTEKSRTEFSDKLLDGLT